MKSLFVLVLTVLLAASAWARDPWKAKSYKDWDGNDLRKILFDSPWSKRVARTSLEAPSSPNQDVSGVDMMGTHSSEAQAGGDTQQSMFLVRWVSSRTLREAWARSMVLQKQIATEAIDQHIPPVPGEYLLAVVGPSMEAFAHADNATLKSKSYLEVNKQKISPAAVEIDHAPDGKISGVVFHFAKADASGHPLISGTEKDVRFVERGAATGFQVDFSPRQMVDAQGPDL
ncbi:MAG TPA: hypothetical protein VFU27_15160 [Terriglobales bacterium]|nr:hypothetical protein [Terriglobales bacterium]